MSCGAAGVDPDSTAAALASDASSADDHLAALFDPAHPDDTQPPPPPTPSYVIYPSCLRARARQFVTGFPGTTLYAVKCNPTSLVLSTLHAAGVRSFDVASLDEARLVRSMFPDAFIAYMHPVKSRAAIRRAYADFAVRAFALDSEDELLKILEETGGAADLTLVVRLAVPACASTMLTLSGKFGADPEHAARLLEQCRQHAARVGLSFHVGSQTMDPHAYTRAMADAAAVAEAAAASGGALDVLDVGGGFPAAYPGLAPPPLEAYFDAIREAAAAHPALRPAAVWCEPGRALVADAGSVVVQVLLRKGSALYVDDGVYGALFDAGPVLGWRYPARALRRRANCDPLASTPTAQFSLFGPTCDSLDCMRGPFTLPANVREGDFVELGQLGAYGAAMATKFNGFYSESTVVVPGGPPRWDA